MSWILLKANNGLQTSGVGDERFFRFKRNVQHLWTAITRHHLNDITHQHVMRCNQLSKFANIFKSIWTIPSASGHSHSPLKVPCSNLAIKMAKKNSQVIWKLLNTIFTHPFHIMSSNEAYFSKFVLNCIDTHPPVYQPHTADIFKPAVGDPKQWRHDRAVRMPTMGISATCFLDPCHPKYRPVFVNQPLSVHIKFTPYSHD